MDFVENHTGYLLKKNLSQTIKNYERYSQNTEKVILYREKVKTAFDKIFSKSLSMQFSLRVHANLIHFFLIDSLDVPLQKYIFNNSPRLNMVKTENK